jgi:hypothetical protein
VDQDVERVVEKRELSIDHRIVRQIVQGCRDVRELLVQHILPARVEGCFAYASHDLKPVSIQLDFVGPFRSIGQSGDRQTIHRLDKDHGLVRHGTLLWHGNQSELALMLPAYTCGQTAEIHGEHLALVNSKSKLAALFYLGVVESWFES